MLGISQNLLQAAKEASEDIDQDNPWVNIQDFPGFIVAREENGDFMCLKKFKVRGNTFLLCQKMEI